MSSRALPNRSLPGGLEPPIYPLDWAALPFMLSVGTFKSTGLSRRQHRIVPHSSRCYGLLPISRHRPSRILPVSLFQTSSTYFSPTTQVGLFHRVLRPAHSLRKITRLAITSPQAAADQLKVFILNWLQHRSFMAVSSFYYFAAYTPGKRILYVFTDNYSRLKPTAVFCRNRIQMRLIPTAI